MLASIKKNDTFVHEKNVGSVDFVKRFPTSIFFYYVQVCPLCPYLFSMRMFFPNEYLTAEISVDAAEGGHPAIP